MRLTAVRPLVVVVTLGLAGCTPRVRLDPAPAIALTADLARADALVNRGCYACLQEALGVYERLAATGEVPAAGLRAIDTALLLALRERELGLGGGTALERAAGLARQQPAPFDIGVFLHVADVQAWHGSGVSKERQDGLMASLQVMFEAWRGWRAWLEPRASRDVVSAYYLLALDCSSRSFLKEAGVTLWRPPPDAPPLLRYRAAVCTLAVDEKALEAIVREEPRFGEAHMFLGELALGRGTLRTAERHLIEAMEAFPDLAAARLTLGHVYLAMEEIEAAREAYHQVNAAVPGQREAMLGEAKSLSYLARAEEAIAVLDQMERLGTWYMGEMYYWRAWNRHRLRQFDTANDDVLASRSRMPMDGQVDKLAGFIALARNEVERAEREFRAAVTHIEGRGWRDCDATYYLGSVQVMQRKWAEAAPNFEKAEPCYVLDQKALLQRIDMIRASDLPEDRKIRLAAAKEKEIAAVRLQEARSCYNAAVAHANLGDAAKARPLAERAASHPEMKSLAEQLLARLGIS